MQVFHIFIYFNFQVIQNIDLTVKFLQTQFINFCLQHVFILYKQQIENDLHNCLQHDKRLSFVATKGA